MKVLFFLALLALAYCDSSITPYILIGTWTLQTPTNATSESLCCLPTGNVTFSNNPNNTVTMTSTIWNGADCTGRPYSYQNLLNVDGAQSWKALSGGASSVSISDVQDDQIYVFSISFNDEVGSMSISNGEDECTGTWELSAQWMTATGAGLIAVIASLLI